MIDKYVLIAYMILVIFNAADVITTMIGLQLGAIEGDKETVFLMQHLGIVEALLIKFFSIVFVGLIAVYFHGRSSLDYRIFIVAFGLGVAYYIKVIINNLQVIWSLIA